MFRGIRSCFSNIRKCFPCQSRLGRNGDDNPDEEVNKDFESVISLTFLDDGPVKNTAKAQNLAAKLKKALAKKEKALAKKARQVEEKERKRAKAQAKRNKKEEAAALASVPIDVRVFLNEVIQLVVAKVEAKAEAKADVTVDETVQVEDESSGQAGCC